ncbi:MAG TPA: hypothetical protein VM571_12695 [Noviherbaspirillum sp.]|nr:hypothetical protein [Noviherbaspirillum sp.]
MFQQFQKVATVSLYVLLIASTSLVSGTSSAMDGTAGSQGADTSNGGNHGGNGNHRGNTPTVNSAWTVTDLSAAIGINGFPTDMNNAGDIVGTIIVTSPPPRAPLGTMGKETAFLYRNGTITDLGTLGGTLVNARGINNKGDIVGTSVVNSRTGELHGFVYSNGNMRDFNELGGNFIALQDINDAGQIIGTNQELHAALFSNGVNQDLGTLPGRNTSMATQINAKGEVLGSSRTFGGGDARSFLYANGMLIDLGSVAGCQTSEFTALNDRTQLAGQCDERLVIRNGESIKDLGGIAGFDAPVATSINNSGQVVGFARKTGTNTGEDVNGFFYDGSQLVDLNTVPSIMASGWRIEAPLVINDSGQILGRGTFQGSSTFRYFLLTPVSK